MTIGSIGAGAGAIFGSGAFTSVSAERNINLTVADDGNSNLALSPASGSDIVGTKSNDDSNVQVEFTDDNLNDDAVTIYSATLKIENQSPDNVKVFVDSGNSTLGPLEFYDADAGNSRSDYLTGSPGGSITGTSSSDGHQIDGWTDSTTFNSTKVDIVVDLTGNPTLDDLPSGEDIVFVASEV